MNTKTLVGGILAGVILFFAGWIVYGMLLMDFMAANTNQCAMKPEEDMSLGLIGVSNVLLGWLLATILGWSGAANAMQGLKHGVLFAALLCLSWDLMMHSMSTWFSNYTAILVDVIGFVIMVGLACAFLGWFLNKDKAQAAQ